VDVPKRWAEYRVADVLPMSLRPLVSGLGGRSPDAMQKFRPSNPSQIVTELGGAPIGRAAQAVERPATARRVARRRPPVVGPAPRSLRSDIYSNQVNGGANLGRIGYPIDINKKIEESERSTSDPEAAGHGLQGRFTHIPDQHWPISAKA
jgi:hypothetical protein